MFERVYTAGVAKSEEGKAESMIEFLFDYYDAHPDRLPNGCLEAADGDKKQAAADFVASMSDNYAIRVFEELAVPRGWSAQ